MVFIIIGSVILFLILLFFIFKKIILNKFVPAQVFEDVVMLFDIRQSSKYQFLEIVDISKYKDFNVVGIQILMSRTEFVNLCKQLDIEVINKNENIAVFGKGNLYQMKNNFWVWDL